jgi:hypothetical protein
MIRVTHSTKATDLFGTGKPGYTDGIVGLVPATVLNSSAVNPFQEEIANVIELSGGTLNGSNNHQMFDAIVARDTTVSSTLLATFTRVAEQLAVGSLKSIYTCTGGSNTPLRAICASTTVTGTPGVIVAVGDDDGIFARVSGGDFQHRSPGSGFNSGFAGCCSGHFGFVVCGNGGEIQSSADGQTWTERHAGGVNFNSCAYLALTSTTGVYCVVGNTGAVYTSVDGTTFTSQVSALGSDFLVSVLAANGLLVVTSAAGRIMTSPTGVVWTVRYTLTGTSPAFLKNQLKWNTAQGFVALYNRNSGEVGAATSSNGTSWATAGSSSLTGIGSETTLCVELLDQQVLYLDVPTAGTARMSAYLQPAATQIPNSTSGTILPAVGNVIPYGSANLAGQLMVVGDNGSGTGCIFAGGNSR